MKWLILLLLIPLSSAHLDGGMDKQAGNYTADLGYSPAPLAEGKKISFALNLADDQGPVEYDTMWIRISGEDVVFAGTLQENSFTYVFPNGGNYDMTVRFMQDEEVVAATGFQLFVKHAFNYMYILVLVLGGVLAWLSNFLIRRMLPS